MLSTRRRCVPEYGGKEDLIGLGLEQVMLRTAAFSREVRLFSGSVYLGEEDINNNVFIIINLF